MRQKPPSQDEVEVSDTTGVEQTSNDRPKKVSRVFTLFTSYDLRLTSYDYLSILLLDIIKIAPLSAQPVKPLQHSCTVEFFRKGKIVHGNRNIKDNVKNK